MTDPCAVALCGADLRLLISKLLLIEMQKNSTDLFVFERRNMLFWLVVYKLQLSISHRVKGSTWNTWHYKLQVRTGSCISIGSVTAFSSSDLMEVLCRDWLESRSQGCMLTWVWMLSSSILCCCVCLNHSVWIPKTQGIGVRGLDSACFSVSKSIYSS